MKRYINCEQLFLLDDEEIYIFSKNIENVNYYLDLDAIKKIRKNIENNEYCPSRWVIDTLCKYFDMVNIISLIKKSGITISMEDNKNGAWNISTNKNAKVFKEYELIDALWKVYLKYKKAA